MDVEGSVELLEREIGERLRGQEGLELQTVIAVLESSDDFIGIATMEGAAFYVNEAGRRMVGLEDIDHVRRTLIADYFTPEDLAYAEQHILPVVMEKGRWQGEFRFRHFKTGATIPVNYNLFLVKDRSTRRPIGIATVTRDITERKWADEERERLREELIRVQAAALQELSTPLIPISDRVVVMPLIGVIDSTRAQQIMQSLLRGVEERGPAVAIIDITGVPIVDTQVANALVNAAKAVKLLGAQVVITGIRPEVAQTIVALGVELHGITTRRTLQSGIAFAMHGET